MNTTVCPLDVGKYFSFPNSNLNCITAETTAGFVSKSARLCILLKRKRAGNASLWQIFSLDKRTLNKISIVTPLTPADLQRYCGQKGNRFVYLPETWFMVV